MTTCSSNARPASPSSTIQRPQRLNALDALAIEFSGKPPIALRYAMEAIHQGLDDMREGTQAFLAKRKPEFKGR